MRTTLDELLALDRPLLADGATGTNYFGMGLGPGEPPELWNVEHGVVHYAVGNMPGAVPHTSTYALTNATLPYILDVALEGPAGAARTDPALALGVNTVAGSVTSAPVAEFLGVEVVDPLLALA